MSSTVEATFPVSDGMKSPQLSGVRREIRAKSYRVAVIPGDGIGVEVMPAAMSIVKIVSSMMEFEVAFEQFDFASADYFLKHQRMLPVDWNSTLLPYDAILFGAVGWPDKVPDHISLDALIQIRRGFDLYVNLRPIRSFSGIPPAVRLKSDQPIDFTIVRENTEGEYSSIGGIAFPDTDREIVLQQTVMTRVGVDRILRYAFALASIRRKRVTSATKSNGITITMPYWDRRALVVAGEFPEVGYEKCHIDALSAKFVLNPRHFDVVVASNLFGDILSDLGTACCGSIGIAPSGNINPERRFPSLFEPVHGSAPDIAGRGLANPVGQIWSAAMMLDHLSEHSASQLVLDAIDAALLDVSARTPDLGGTASTMSCTNAICTKLEAMNPS